MNTAHLHPLAALLPDWRWFDDLARAETLILHPFGLHFYLPTKMLAGTDLDRLWPAVATACAYAVEAGMTGRCDVEFESPTYEHLFVDPLAEARRPGSGTMMVCTSGWSSRLVPVKP